MVTGIKLFGQKMGNFSYQRFVLCFLFLLYANAVLVLGDCNTLQSYYIRSTTAGLTLDATEPSGVKLQHFTGLPPQQWRFECGTIKGNYFIVNQASGQVLDITRSGTSYVVLNVRDGSLYQQWALTHKGRIVNAWLGSTSGVLGVENELFVPGAAILTSQDVEKKAQEFTLQEQTKK